MKPLIHNLQQTNLNKSLIVAATLGAVLLTGCNTTSPASYATVKMPPAMRYQPTDQSHTDTTARNTHHNYHAIPANAVQTYTTSSSARPTMKDILSRIEVMHELREQGVMALPTVNDHKYVIPQHTWVRNDYNRYFDSYIYYLGAEYNAEGMDCDNFANFYRQNLVLANLKAGGARLGDVPCATIVVNQRDKGIFHALNLIRTNRGWFVIEPQDGTLTQLKSYRYLRDITKVTF